MTDAKSWLDIISKLVPVGVITAIGGYFVRMFQTERRKKRMQEQLYREISNNYQNLVVRIALVTSVSGLRQAAPMRFTDKLDLSFGVWEFYNDEKRRDMLFDLKEAGTINRIYEKFSIIGNEELPGYAPTCGERKRRLKWMIDCWTAHWTKHSIRRCLRPKLGGSSMNS